MGIHEQISFKTPTMWISCDICDKSMGGWEIEKIQNFPLTGKSIVICGECASILNKKALKRFLNNG